jgi:hypothetical protein
MMVRSLLILVTTSLLTGCSAFGIRSGYEQPSYVLVETLSHQIEMRRSAPRLAVETTVDISKTQALASELWEDINK